MRRWFQNLRRAFQAKSTPPRPRTCRLAVEQLEDRRLLSADFLQTNLVSDIPGLAAFTDPQLINPWGLTASGGSPFWVSDNQTGFSTLYNGQGVKAGLVVAIPSAPGSPFTHATPTGTVFNTDSNANDFEVTAIGKKGPVTARSIFLFDTLDGTISGWNGTGTNAVIAPVDDPNAIFTGLAIDTSASAGNSLLYAADWGKGTVDVFNGSFTQVDKGSFQDPAIPSDFRPFNVQDLNGHIFVTYAQFAPATGADTGTGGFVAEFSRDGVLETTIKGGGHLNSPWGLAMAPQGFGDLGGDLLVGNFGDGHINAFNLSDPSHGNANFEGTLTDASEKPITIENLWAIRFGNGGAAGSTNTLFFTAGLTDAPATIFGATDGLLGSLQAISSVRRHEPLLPNLPAAAKQTFSTVPPNGDTNPYGVAFVPTGFEGGGALHAGDVLVSNFNNSVSNGGLQGTGTTIVRIAPTGEHSVFFQGQAGLGLTTALGVLKEGFVIVGSVPTTDGTPATLGQGSLTILDSSGNVVETLTDSALLDSPWDLTINDRGNTAQVFVSNVRSGTVTRIDLSIPEGGKPIVESETRIASGYATGTDPVALVVGPTGLAFDAKTDTLFVASTKDNEIFAISDARHRQSDTGTGKVVFKDDAHLRGPLGLILAPNGDLIASNGDAVNGDPKQPSELVEFTRNGKFVSQFSIDPNQGGAFGIAAATFGDELRFAAVNDNTNSLEVWTFEVGHHE